MKKLLLGTLATLCIALGLTIAKPVEANAASISIDTAYGEMTLHEDSYTDYLMWKQDNGHYAVFYNGDITCSAITDTEATLVFPDTAVVYSYDNNYIREEQTGVSLVMKYTKLPYYASTKAVSQTIDEKTLSLSVRKYITNRDVQQFVTNIAPTGNYYVFRVDGVVKYVSFAGNLPYLRPNGTFYRHNSPNSTYSVDICTYDGTSSSWSYTASLCSASAASYLKSLPYGTTSIEIFPFGYDRLYFMAADGSGGEGNRLPAYTSYTSPKFDVFAGASDVEIEVVPTIVNITLPLNVGLAINVNAEDAVVHGDIAVTNNSKAPVKVKLHAVSSTDIPFTNLIKPTDLPAELEWDLLNLENSQKYFAFGVKPEEEGDTWKSITATDYVWAESGFTPTELGIIAGSSSGALSLDARFGRVQTVEHDFTFSATFVAELQ